MKNPNRNYIDAMFHDWKLFLGVFAVCMVLVGAAHAYLIYRVGQGDIFSTSPSARDESIFEQKKVVRRVNSVFEQKKTAYSQFEIDRPEEIDPSL